jgi:membrane-bound metal-dependent hydrolase YbcI (DUF457 family)
MPDWISHILLGLMAGRMFKAEKDISIPASVLADIDHALSFLNPGLSLPISFLIGGRFMHNLLGVAALSLMFASLYGEKYLKISAGFLLLHLGLDMCVSEGIPLLYPLPAWFSVGIFETYTPWIPVGLSVLYSALTLYSRHNSGNP